MMQYMAWNARYDVQCIWVLWKKKDDHGINLENQACHWKDGVISVEINIKIMETDTRFANDEQNKNDAKLRLTTSLNLRCITKLCYITTTWQQMQMIIAS